MGKNDPRDCRSAETRGGRREPLNRDPLDNLDDDIRDHLERETRDNVDRGMSPEEARYAALRKFGNVARVKEETRAVWSSVRLEELAQDGRYAIRTLRRAPVFAAVILLTLGFGIGMNTAIFSVINTVLLRPVAYPHPERLVWIADYDPNIERDYVSLPDFIAWRKSVQSFAAMAAYSPQQSNVQTPGGATQADGVAVGGDFWPITSPRPVLGRVFGPEEQGVIVLSWDFFEREFATDPAVVGTVVLVDGRPATIVGVLPKNFRFEFPMWWTPSRTDPIDVYIPLSKFDVEHARSVSVVGLTKPGVRIGNAFAEVQVLEKQIASRGPRWRPFSSRLRAEPLQQKLAGSARAALLVLLGAGVFVLLIAAANIANLLLARAATRRREIAVRAAVGAGRARLIRQLLVENIAIAILSGAVGLTIAQWAIATVIRLAPNAIPRLTETAIDGRVLGFTFGVSIGMAILFGTAPALSLARTGLCERLRGGDRISSGFRLRRLLVAAEIALAVILLTGAGLMLRSFWRMNAHPDGFAPEKILTFKLRLTGARYEARSAQNEYMKTLIRSLESIPGVRAAGISAWWLFAGVPFPTDAPGDEPHVIRINGSSPGYLKALGMRLVRGRWLTDSDPIGTVLMNESMAREAFGSEDPIGGQIKVPTPATVVGIVADLKYNKLDADPAPEVFITYQGGFTLLRTVDMAVAAANPSGLVDAIRKIVTEIDPQQAIFGVKTLDQALAESIAPRRFNLFLLASFAVVALILAVAGVYGVMAYSVAERTREIGVRVALGARSAQVIRMVVLDGMSVAIAGIFLGTIAAWFLTRLMTKLLYGVTADDPATFSAIAILLAATALAACFGPALRAATIDPAITLRHD